MKVLAATVRVNKEKVDTARSFFNSFEKWTDIAAFEKHCTQPFLKEFKSRYEELLESPNQLLWLTPL